MHPLHPKLCQPSLHFLGSFCGKRNSKHFLGIPLHASPAAFACIRYAAHDRARFPRPGTGYDTHRPLGRERSRPLHLIKASQDIVFHSSIVTDIRT